MIVRIFVAVFFITVLATMVEGRSIMMNPKPCLCTVPELIQYLQNGMNSTDPVKKGKCYDYIGKTIEVLEAFIHTHRSLSSFQDALKKIIELTYPELKKCIIEDQDFQHSDFCKEVAALYGDKLRAGLNVREDRVEDEAIALGYLASVVSSTCAYESKIL
jgi:phage tail protein X